MVTIVNHTWTSLATGANQEEAEDIVNRFAVEGNNGGA